MEVKQELHLVDGLQPFDQGLDCLHLGEELLVEVASEASVEVVAEEAGAVIAHNHSVRVDHRHNEEVVGTQQQLRGKQLTHNRLNGEVGAGLAGMRPPQHDNALPGGLVIAL